MLILLNIILYKYSSKYSTNNAIKNKYIYKRNKEYFRLILKNIIIFYKNLFNPFFLNNFSVYKLHNSFVLSGIFKEENLLKNFYC